MHLGDVVPLDVAHAVQRHKARKGHSQVVPQRQDLAALKGAGRGGSGVEVRCKLAVHNRTAAQRQDLGALRGQLSADLGLVQG